MNIYLIIGVCLVVLIYILITYNRLVKLRNLVNEALSTMDVYLKKRWDLVPNLVECVKEYMKHEKDTFERITKIRMSWVKTNTITDKADLDNQLSEALKRIYSVSENYAELKADTTFIQLTNELTIIERDIANSRKYYNGTIRNYNNIVQMFPSNIVAFVLGFKSQKMFEIPTEERKNEKGIF